MVQVNQVNCSIFFDGYTRSRTNHSFHYFLCCCSHSSFYCFFNFHLCCAKKNLFLYINYHKNPSGRKFDQRDLPSFECP